MKTEKFIETSYEEQKKRIRQELEEAVEALNLEKGIINTQKKVKVHETLFLVREQGHVCLLHFNCGGVIEFKVRHSSSGRTRVLASNTQKKHFFEINISDDAFEVQHLKFLKKIHPKTFPEHLRHAGKKFLVGDE